MDRARPLPWPAAALVAAVSLASLGDTCPARNRGAEASRGKPEAAPAAASLEPAPTSSEPAYPPAAAVPSGAAGESLAAAVPEPSAADTKAPTFEATVRPILAVRCAPCHNPGGKMYEQLPFDQAAVVSGHAPGVRRRLKDEDLLAFERWMATLPASSD